LVMIRRRATCGWLRALQHCSLLDSGGNTDVQTLGAKSQASSSKRMVRMFTNSLKSVGCGSSPSRRRLQTPHCQRHVGFPWRLRYGGHGGVSQCTFRCRQAPSSPRASCSRRNRTRVRPPWTFSKWTSKLWRVVAMWFPQRSETVPFQLVALH